MIFPSWLQCQALLSLPALLCWCGTDYTSSRPNLRPFVKMGESRSKAACSGFRNRDSSFDFFKVNRDLNTCWFQGIWGSLDFEVSVSLSVIWWKQFFSTLLQQDTNALISLLNGLGAVWASGFQKSRKKYFISKHEEQEKYLQSHNFPSLLRAKIVCTEAAKKSKYLHSV